MSAEIDVTDFVGRWKTSPFARVRDAPWSITQVAEVHIRRALKGLGAGYRREGEIAVHETATVESGAVLKGPLIIGPRVFVAAGGYLRGGVFLDEDCIVGPSCELKTTFMFAGSKVAHFNFVGDSILGSGVNLEAGSIVANYRNELADKAIRIVRDGAVIETGVTKFGVLAGDGVRIGANAVVAPGAILDPDAIVPRLGLADHYPGR